MLVFDLSTRRWSVNDDLYTSDIAASVTPVKSATILDENSKGYTKPKRIHLNT